MKITIFEQKKVLLSTNKGYISYHNKKTEIIVIIQINTELLYKAYAIYNMEHLKKQDLPVFHNVSKYDYDFSCFGENMGKRTTSSVPIEKEIKRFGKRGKELKAKIIS